MVEFRRDFLPICRPLTSCSNPCGEKKVRELSGFSVMMVLIPFVRASPSRHHLLPKVPTSPPIPSRMGLGYQHMTFGEITTIQSVMEY